uniref:Ribosomal protein L10 n=1 Tax=Pleurosigma intermedium TaxID=197753 RepID=A0A8F9R3J8_9STRA|nr:ribosomal protein L10 [Pleurosigma sp. mgcode 4]
MKFKNYQILKIKHYFKNNSILLLSNGINQKANNWVKLEQGFKIINLNYYKTYNKIARKVLKTSVYSNVVNLINGPFFLLTPNKKTTLTKKLLKKETLEFLKFRLLALKLNKKIYSINQIKKINSFVYKEAISVLYQFLLVNLKFPQTLIKSRNNVIWTHDLLFPKQARYQTTLCFELKYNIIK